MKSLTMLFLLISAIFNALTFFSHVREARRKARLRRQRLFVYAQFAEKFIEWGGLVPPAVGKNEDQPKIIRRRIANDDGSIFEPDVERLARSEDLRKRWLDLDAMARKVELSDTAGERLHADNPFRPLAYVLADNGYLGPFPLSWVKGIRCFDRKGKPCFAEVKVLPDSDSGKDGGEDTEDK